MISTNFIIRVYMHPLKGSPRNIKHGDADKRITDNIMKIDFFFLVPVDFRVGYIYGVHKQLSSGLVFRPLLDRMGRLTRPSWSLGPRPTTGVDVSQSQPVATFGMGIPVPRGPTSTDYIHTQSRDRFYFLYIHL